MAVMDIILRAKDQASSVLNAVGKNGKGSGLQISDGMKKASLAISAAGVAIEGLARQQAPLTENTRRVANAMNMTEKEMRQLAISTSNVTFPLEDVLDLFEQGRQQGIRSSEQLKEYAEFWDMVGDATGENASQLANSSVALNALGIEVENQSEALSAFGFVAQETSQDIGGLLYFVERSGPQLREMGMDINDTAAVMGILEKELGMTSRTARQEFRSAVSESNGDLNAMLQTLGITSQTFDEYRQQVQASSNIIQENSEIHEQSYTLLQRVQSAIGDLTYRYGAQIETLSNLSMIMMSAAPIMHGLAAANKGLTAAKLVATKAMTAFGVSVNFALWPVLAVIAAIAGLVAIGWVLYKNWDKIINSIKKIFEGFLKFMKFIIQTLIAGVKWYIDTVKNNFVAVVEFLKGIWNSFADFFVNLWNGIGNAVKAPINLIISAVNTMIKGLNRIKINIPQWVPIMGGNSFGFNIPQIPRLHTGGTYHAQRAGGEGLALLRDGEVVRTPEEERRRGDSIVPKILNVIIQLDGREIARKIMPYATEEIIIKGGVS